MKKKRIFAGFLGITMILTAVVGVAPQAGAQTTTSTATIENLQALIMQLQAQLAALMAGGGTTGTRVVFNTNLTIGSTGADVTELQRYLVSQGMLQMPINVSYGYFGTLTRAAVARWQASQGITPAVGYFGPITRARLNALFTTTTPTTPTTPGTGNGGITTPGVEGTLTVSLNPTPSSGQTIREGDNEEAVMGLKIEARQSDIRIERIQIELPNAAFYNNIADRISIAEGSTVLASSNLNSSTVIREGSRYYINITGLSYIVPRNTTRVLNVLVDINSSVDSNDQNTSITLTIPADGVRGIDGAGIYQYGPSSSISRSFRVGGDLAEDASIQLSLSSNNPVASEVVAASGSDEDELDALTILRFNLRAERDTVLVTDLVATITGTGVATTSTAYLYDGNNIIGSASISGTTATFEDIDLTINRDQTRELSLRVDIRDAANTNSTVTASITASGITAENSQGEIITGGDRTGSATGETMTIRNVGPAFSLVSKTITKSQTPQQDNTSTSTANAEFNIRVRAVGGDITFGTQASTSPMVTFGIYQGSTLVATAVSSSTSLTIPSGAITSGVGTNSFKISENNEVTIPVTFLFEGRTTAGALLATGSYSVGIESINWSSDNGATIVSSTFMAGETDWRTSSVSMP